MQRIGLDQHTVQIQRAQQLLEGCAFAGFVGVIGLLGQSHTKGSGIDRDLGHKVVVALIGQARGAPQGLAVTHQLVQTACPARDLADHPGLEHLPEFLQVGLVKQVQEGGIGRPALEIQAQGLVQRLAVPLGESLQIARAAAPTEDPEHRHQQQEPLRVTHPATVTTVRDRLEEADQVRRCRLIDCDGIGGGHRQRRDPPT